MLSGVVFVFFTFLFRFHSLCHWCPFIYAMTTDFLYRFITSILLCDGQRWRQRIKKWMLSINMNKREWDGKRWWSDDTALDLLFIQRINFDISVMPWQTHIAAAYATAAARLGNTSSAHLIHCYCNWHDRWNDMSSLWEWQYAWVCLCSTIEYTIHIEMHCKHHPKTFFLKKKKVSNNNNKKCEFWAYSFKI